MDHPVESSSAAQSPSAESTVVLDEDLDNVEALESESTGSSNRVASWVQTQIRTFDPSLLLLAVKSVPYCRILTRRGSTPDSNLSIDVSSDSGCGSFRKSNLYYRHCRYALICNGSTCQVSTKFIHQPNFIFYCSGCYMPRTLVCTTSESFILNRLTIQIFTTQVLQPFQPYLCSSIHSL